ncbi:MAG: hypothetical protein MH204_12045, partial [Fimbriimonadaceae bacterium]|nr:hypothetical protein [Fimbriimonadaceae bacterium]
MRLTVPGLEPTLWLTTGEGLLTSFFGGAKATLDQDGALAPFAFGLPLVGLDDPRLARRISGEVQVAVEEACPVDGVGCRNL